MVAGCGAATEEEGETATEEEGETATAGTLKLVAMYCLRPSLIWSAARSRKSSATTHEATTQQEEEGRW
uniref:Uncharacterized protein n=1 Tax=Arundo donax TaxID=35708 RepID=A0A0A9ABE8_ARUDO